MCVLFGGIFRFLTDFLHWHLSQRKALVQELNAATSTYVDGATRACMHTWPPFMRVRWWTYYHAHAPTHYHDCAYEYVHSRCLSLLGLCVCVCVCVCVQSLCNATRLRGCGVKMTALSSPPSSRYPSSPLTTSIGETNSLVRQTPSR